MIIDEKIPGWMSRRELEVIAEVAASVPDNGLIVEIGSYAGRSSYHWAANSQPSVKLVCVEPFATTIDPDSRVHLMGESHLVDQGDWCYDLFMHYMKPVFHKVELVTQPSPLKKWDRLADVVFVDGDHMTASVLADLKFWWPRLKPGGRLLGHDADMPSIQQALTEFGKPYRVHPGGSIWELERC
jgi:hypothetical protein